MNRLLAILLLTVTALGVTEPETHSKPVFPADPHNYSAVRQELLTLRADNAEKFAAENYDYLLARVAEAEGDVGLSLGNYQAVIARHSVLSPWALKHSAQLARSTGNLPLERLYLMEIGAMFPNSILAGGAARRLARNSFEGGNYSETIRILTAGAKNVSADKVAVRENQCLLADAYLNRGDVERARTMYADLVNTIPVAAQPDDIALSAVKNLDLIAVGSENFDKKVPDLSEAEQMQRANIYQFNRDFARAKMHFENLIGNFPSGVNTAEASYQIGRAMAQQLNYVSAVEWFERVLERYPDSLAAKDALLQAATAYARVGKSREAIRRYQVFITKYPADERLDRAYLNIVDVLRDQTDDNEALKWCAKTEAAFKGKPAEAVAAFAETRIYIARNEWQNALDSLNRLKGFSDLGANLPGGTSIAETTFMRGIVLEQLKRYDEAVDTYLTIPTGRGEYYGWRANQRLEELRKDETAKSFISQKTGSLSADLKAKDADQRRIAAQTILRLTDSPELTQTALESLRAALKSLAKYQGVPASKLTSTSSAPAFGRADAALISLGLYDEGALEMESADPLSAKSFDDKAYTLATYYKRGDRADRAFDFIESFWRKMPADYPVELIPRDQLEMLYPAPYVSPLTRYAPEHGVDPRLMLSIMRQESRFRPDVKSYAAARGLMQFISTTANTVARELNNETFEQDDLYYPPTAIVFGSRYLADLFKSFPGQPDAVIASYNGGDDNMKRWFARSRSTLSERYVPEIMYVQSKDYVYKVMSNYRMYEYMYDENLQAK